MTGLSCALSGASCCVLPIYFEATRFLSGYCGALCFIFCQVIIKECPDIYCSSTECLNLSHPITFVRASLACLGISREWRRDTGPGNIQPMMLGACKFRNIFLFELVNHQHFRLVSSTKVKIDLVIVFIFKDTFSSRLSLVLVTGKRSRSEEYTS